MVAPPPPMAMDHSDRAPALIGVMVAGLAVSLVIVPLRFYTRAYIVRKIGADDWLALISFVSRESREKKGAGGLKNDH
jgi:hypothetical protein